MSEPLFKAGRNIALKIPPSEYDQTVAFYRDVLQLRELGTSEDGAIGFDFDGKDLWLDRVETMSQAEMWLQICAEDIEAAAAYFEKMGVTRCDEIEVLPEGFQGFWVKNAASLVHLVSKGS